MKKIKTLKAVLALIILTGILLPLVQIEAVLIMSSKNALKYIFPDATANVKEEKTLSKEQMDQIKKSYGWKVPKNKYTVYQCKKGKKLLGRLIFFGEKGKHGLMWLGVGVNLNGSVKNVAVCSLKEIRGKPVTSKMFLRQFKRKTVKNSLKVGKDIQAVTNATTSSVTVSRAVKKVLILIKTIYS